MSKCICSTLRALIRPTSAIRVQSLGVKQYTYSSKTIWYKLFDLIWSVCKMTSSHTRSRNYWAGVRSVTQVSPPGSCQKANNLRWRILSSYFDLYGNVSVSGLVGKNEQWLVDQAKTICWHCSTDVRHVHGNSSIISIYEDKDKVEDRSFPPQHSDSFSLQICTSAEAITNAKVRLTCS